MITAVLVTTIALGSAVGWLPAGRRWANTPVPYCITGNARQTRLSAATQRQEVTNAIDQWRSSGSGGHLSCSTYNATAQSTSSCNPTVDSNDGQHNIFWESNWSQGSQTIGVTWSTAVGNCGSVTDNAGRRWNLTCTDDADIEFNDVDYTWTNDGTQTDIASIAVHEYGHFIGLDHCNENQTCDFGTAVMYAAYSPGDRVRVPFSDDVTGACALYPGTQGGLAWPCTSTGQCRAAPICVNPSSGGYCTQTCTGSGQGSCPTGYLCQANPQNAGQTVCLKDDGLNRALCEVCQGSLPNACANNGQCYTGIPERNAGRCVTPCPNASHTPDGDCPTDYTCLQVGSGSQSGHYCFPRSSDCTDLTNYRQLQLGQTCSGNPPCAAGLDCIGICSPKCTGGPGRGDCPAGYACESFNFQTGPESYCAPPVNEGQSCTGIKACTTGPCLLSDQNIATCYRDCAGDPNACNNAQTCNTYNLQGGGSVSICEPPGVPPRPDAGLPPDTGVEPACPCDTSNNCERGCSCDPNCPPPDAGAGFPDASVQPPDAGQQPPTCDCDRTYGCDGNCDCDPECRCDCDQTYACDENCACDQDCKPSSSCSTCTSAEGRPGPLGSPFALLGVTIAGLGLFGARRTTRGSKGSTGPKARS